MCTCIGHLYYLFDLLYGQGQFSQMCDGQDIIQSLSLICKWLSLLILGWQLALFSLGWHAVRHSFHLHMYWVYIIKKPNCSSERIICLQEIFLTLLLLSGSKTGLRARDITKNMRYFPE